MITPDNLKFGAVTLQNDVMIDGDAVIGNDTNLNGNNLSVTGNLQQRTGVLKLSGGTLDIGGDYSMSGENDGVAYYASLNMTDESDQMRVGGNVVINSDKTSSLTNGVMYIAGRFTQKSDGSRSNFYASGQHKVVLNGTKLQKITFESYPDSMFNILELRQNDEQYVFSPDPCWNEKTHFCDHSRTEIRDAAEVTCIDDGYTGDVYCADCGILLEKGKVIEAEGHKTVTSEAVEPTCTEDGKTAGRHCSVCGKVFAGEEVIPATGHSYSDWTTTKEANCTEDGERVKECPKCGDVVKEAIPATGHSWDTDYTVDKPATATEDGIESIHCTKCNAIQEGSERIIPATEEHNFGEWVIIKEATCTEPGTKERTCLDCDKKETVEIPATDHHWGSEFTVDKEATCSATGSESIHCTVCGASDESSVREIEKLPHEFGEWVTEKEPTFTDEGQKTHTCSVCGEKESAPIPCLSKPELRDAEISGITDKTYNGKPQTQTVVVILGDKILKEGEDYDLAYRNNTDAGEAAVVIIGSGDYEGAVTKSFTIKKALNPLTVKVGKPVVKYSSLKKKNQTITVKKAFTVSKAQGKVTYKKSSGNKKIVISSAGKITVKKGLKKGKYKVKVIVKAAGNSNYKAGSKTVTLTITVK